MLLFYGVLLGIAVSLAVAAYRLTRHLGRRIASIVAVGVVGVEALLCPIPIHGGFTFPIEIAISELSSLGRAAREAQDRSADREFLASLEARFAGPLEPVILERGPDGWIRATNAAGDELWLDESSGLLWRGPLAWDTATAVHDLGSAEAFCAALEPEGHWALPTEGELLTLWRAHGHARMPGDGRSSLSVLVAPGMRAVLAARFAGNAPGYSLRCVARTETAPARGYVSEDFPLRESNRFQLEKRALFE